MTTRKPGGGEDHAGPRPRGGAALDGMDIPERVGSLAGDDTVLLVLRTTESAKEFCQTIREMLQ